MASVPGNKGGLAVARGKLEAWLAARKLPPGARLPAERALAGELGVSHSSMNRAVLQLLSEGQLERQGYRLTRAAVRPWQPRPVVLHALLPRPDQFLRGLEQALRAGGHRLEVEFCNNREEYHAAALRALRQRVTGLLLGPPTWYVDVALLRRMEEAGLVYLTMDTPGARWRLLRDYDEEMRLAVGHLREMGHRRIGFVSSIAPGQEEERFPAFRRALREIPEEPSADLLWEYPNQEPPHLVQRGMVAYLRRNPRLQALVLAGSYTPFRAACDTLGRSPPAVVVRDLEITFGDLPAPAVVGPSLFQAGWLAADLLVGLVRQQELGERLPGPLQVRLVPSLRPAAGVGEAIGRSGAVPPARPGAAASEAVATPQTEEEVHATWRTPYPLTCAIAPDRIQPVDLRGTVNRALRRYHGWLGDQPLLHLPPGRVFIHGVPFQVLAEGEATGCAALVLRSVQAQRHERQPLPEEVEIALPERVRAVYFLHGCGFVQHLKPFAWYTFRYRRGRSVTVPLVPYPLVPDSFPPGHPDRARANLADWWPEHPQFRREGCRPVVVAARGHPKLYSRFLYTLEWINPHPERPLRDLRIRSNPAASETLGIVAISVLLDGDPK